jgi:hypothetical protein
MRALLCTALLSLVLVAGCGGDDDGGGGGGGAYGGGGGQATAKPGGDEGAQAFIDCFKAPGYDAVRPKPREESLFALQAKNKGFANTPVNVTEPKAISAGAFLVFFEDEGKAKQALDEVGATSVGDVPPQQRGPAVIGYFSEDDKKRTESAINGCL